MRSYIINSDRDIFGPPEAAVLVPFFQKRNIPYLLFIQRADHLNKHSGQISFPGGKIEDRDRDIVETAIRETGEEVGILPDAITIIGRFDDFATPHYQAVASVIGSYDYPVKYSLSDEEIGGILEVPVRDLIDPSIYRSEVWQWKGQDHVVHFYDWKDKNGDIHTIWGATAYILNKILAIISE